MFCNTAIVLPESPELLHTRDPSAMQYRQLECSNTSRCRVYIGAQAWSSNDEYGRRSPVTLSDLHVNVAAEQIEADMTQVLPAADASWKTLY